MKEIVLNVPLRPSTRRWLKNWNGSFKCRMADRRKAQAIIEAAENRDKKRRR